MLSINISELIWTIINFFLLYFVLKRFLFTPVCRLLDERQEKIDASLNEEKQAQEAGRVIGAEIVPEAVENARQNAKENRIENVEFLCADAGQAALALGERGLQPDVVVVDPPRKGMYQEAVMAVASMHPRRIVYVSCEPSTLARDILRFSELGYSLSAATAFDLFPRTKHVETVALLERLPSF